MTKTWRRILGAALIVAVLAIIGAMDFADEVAREAELKEFRAANIPRR